MSESERCCWQTDIELWDKLKPLARQMRHVPTKAENILWQRLRGKRFFDLRFRRQYVYDKFILDLYCPKAKLAIEIDGHTHDYTQEEDAIRQAFLETQGFVVLRFSNEDILCNTEGVLYTIADRLQQMGLIEPSEI